MPESPECRKQAEFLSHTAQQGPLSEIEVLSGRYTKKPLPGLDEIRASLPLKTIGGGVHGKFIYLVFENGSSAHITLGMSGGFLTKSTSHARVRFRWGNRDVFFTDARNFGTLKFTQSTQELSKKLEKLGPDIMQGGADEFIRRCLKRSHWNICKALMDQSIVAGIGNYIKAELLYELKINPWCAVGDLAEDDLREVFDRAGDVAWRSYNLGGATIQSYRDPSGAKGEAARRFAVYGQKKSPAGFDILREQTPDGRTTHWSPGEQTRFSE